MGTWTPTQIMAAAKVNVRATIDDDNERTNAMLVASAQMKSALVEEFADLGLKVDGRDVHLEQRKDQTRGQVQLRAFWMPATRTVELYGGARDGDTTKVPVVGNLLVTSPGPMDQTSVLQMGPELLDSLLVYKLAGWSEESRHWVYELDPRR